MFRNVKEWRAGIHWLLHCMWIHVILSESDEDLVHEIATSTRPNFYWFKAKMKIRPGI